MFNEPCNPLSQNAIILHVMGSLGYYLEERRNLLKHVL